jgi:hypothetical protein
MNAEARAEFIRRTVDSFPPMSDEQIQRIAALLAPVNRPGGGRK